MRIKSGEMKIRESVNLFLKDSLPTMEFQILKKSKTATEFEHCITLGYLLRFGEQRRRARESLRKPIAAKQRCDSSGPLGFEPATTALSCFRSLSALQHTHCPSASRVRSTLYSWCQRYTETRGISQELTLTFLEG